MFQLSYQSEYIVLVSVSTRTYFRKCAYSLKRVRRTDIAFELVAEEPFREALIMHLNFDVLALVHKAGQAYTFQLK